MKYIFSFILFGLFCFQSSFTQHLEPVKWEFKSVKQADNNYILDFTAKIDRGWYLYSQNIEEGGPIPTSFHLDEGDAKIDGKIEELGEAMKKFDKMFEMEIIKFAGHVTFRAKAIVPASQNILKGYLQFMTCDDTRCLPPEEIEFEFDLSQSENQN